MRTDEFVLGYLDKLEGRLVEIALAIWANPESGLNEFFASKEGVGGPAG